MPKRFTKTKKKKPSKNKKKRSMWTLQSLVGLFLIIIFGFLIAALWHVTRIEVFQITHVEIIGGHTISHSEIEIVVHELLEGEYFMIIPRTFFLTYPKNKIINHVLDIPRIKNTTISLIDKYRLVLTFEEYIPHSLWCDEIDTRDCFFMDEFGYSFSKAPDLTGSAFIRYIKSEVPPASHTQAFDSSFIKQSQRFIAELSNNLDLHVTYVKWVDELDVIYTVSGGGRIKLSQSLTLDQSFRNLQSVLNSADFMHLQDGDFQYIDLRFGNKIFLKEEEIPEPHIDYIN